MLDDGETKAGAGGIARRIGLVEPFEEPDLVLGGDADPGVLDLNRGLLVGLIGAEGNGAPGRGEFDGVVDEVDQHLFHALAIHPDWFRNAADLEVQRKICPFNLGLETVGRVVNQVRDVDPFVAEA